jgi:hypothetical protein
VKISLAEAKSKKSTIYERLLILPCKFMFRLKLFRRRGLLADLVAFFLLILTVLRETVLTILKIFKNKSYLSPSLPLEILGDSSSESIIGVLFILMLSQYNQPFCEQSYKACDSGKNDSSKIVSKLEPRPIAVFLKNSDNGIIMYIISPSRCFRLSWNKLFAVNVKLTVIILL